METIDITNFYKEIENQLTLPPEIEASKIPMDFY